MSKQQEQEIKELKDKIEEYFVKGTMPLMSYEYQDLAEHLISSGYVNINNIKLMATIKSRGRYYKQGEGRPDEKVFGYEEDDELYESSGYLVFLTDKDLT